MANPRLMPHTGADLLARKNSEGTRSRYQPPSQGGSGGGSPSQGGGFANTGGTTGTTGTTGTGGWNPGVGRTTKGYLSGHPGSGKKESLLDKWKQHAIFSKRYKWGKKPDYHKIAALDFRTRYSNINPNLAKALGYGYQGLTETTKALGKPTSTNIFGLTRNLYSGLRTALTEGQLNALGIDQYDTGSDIEKAYLAAKTDMNLQHGGLVNLYKYGGFSG